MGNHSIKLKNYLNIIKELRAAAASAIIPGMLIERVAAGTVQAHSSAGGNAHACIALEDSLQGNGIDDVYTVGDPVQCWYPQRGDEGYIILKDDSAAVVIGSFLESAGDGTFQLHEASSAGAVEYPMAIICVALEAMDLTGSSGEESSGPLGYDKRIKVEFI